MRLPTLALALALALAAPLPAFAAPAPAGPGAPRPAIAPSPAVAAGAASQPEGQEGPGTWDGGVALPLAMSTLGGLSVAALALGFSRSGWNSTGEANPLALGAGTALLVGATLTPWLMRPKGSGNPSAGPMLSTAFASAGLLLAPTILEQANFGGLETLLAFGAPLAFGGALGWSLGELAAEAPARRGGPYPPPWTTHVLATGTSLGTAALGVSLATTLPSPLNVGGPALVLLSPVVGLGIGHHALGDAPRGMFLGASLYGPTLLGGALPLLGSAGLTGSLTGGRGKYMGAIMAVLGAAGGLAGGIGATAIDLEHRAGARQPKAPQLAR